LWKLIFIHCIPFIQVDSTYLLTQSIFILSICDVQCCIKIYVNYKEKCTNTIFVILFLFLLFWIVNIWIRIEDSNVNDTLVDMWKVKLPPKVNIFLWRMLWNKLPSRDNLMRRNIIGEDGDLSCLFCQNSNEFVIHLSFGCLRVDEIWKIVMHGWVLKLLNFPYHY